MLVFDFSLICRKLEIENNSIGSFNKNGSECCTSLFCLSDFTGGVSFSSGDEYGFGVAFGGDIDSNHACGFGITWNALHRAYAAHHGCTLKELKKSNEEWDMDLFESDWYSKLVDEFILFVKSKLGA